MNSDVITVSVRMPVDYHKKLQEAARAEDRRPSNFAWHTLKRILDGDPVNNSDLDKAQDSTARA